jgi:GDP-D-mannose 3', 5'-epimerase
MKTALVCGGSGFIGHHLAKRLHSEGYKVRVVDLKYPEYGLVTGIEYVIGDLRNRQFVDRIIVDKHQEPFYTPKPFDEVYQLAADMGGAGYIFTGEHDADVMHNSATINLNVCQALVDCGFKGKVFYSSSACMYPQDIQEGKGWVEGWGWREFSLKESDAYPANPDSEYGWEKLFSERLFLAYARNYGLNVRIARFHNIFGPEGTWKGGKEKAPAAICRKVAESDSEIEIWGDGEQTRSFLYIDECIEGVRRLMESDFIGPVNIGSDEMISINDLASMVMAIAGKKLAVKHVPGPTGVRGRNSDNTLIFEKLGWKPSQPLQEGLEKTFHWINKQVNG